MFRGRQANLCSNKFLYEKQIKQRQKAHKDKLANMKPAIDNSAPKKPSHLASNKKREQMMEDRYTKIERENRLLLEKMSHIMQKKSLDNSNQSWKYTKSLNKSYRKQQLQKITQENQDILRRIQQREPHYNHVEWEEDRKVHEQYLRNICEYPVDERREKRKKHTRSGLIPSLDSSYQKQSQEKLMKNSQSNFL